MALILWLLTAALVIDCLILALLVLIQLPKKEAGLGMAFGGGTADALLGAGSGDVLTRITKYAAGIFLGLALLISVMITKQHHSDKGGLSDQLARPDTAAPALATQPAATTPAATTPATTTPLTIAPGTPAASQPAPTTPAPATTAPATPTAPAPATPK
ncbi:MAG: preprotein translocase subunit SecG [Verrucomicrobiota bacterium]